MGGPWSRCANVARWCDELAAWHSGCSQADGVVVLATGIGEVCAARGGAGPWLPAAARGRGRYLFAGIDALVVGSWFGDGSVSRGKARGTRVALDGVAAAGILAGAGRRGVRLGGPRPAWWRSAVVSCWRGGPRLLMTAWFWWVAAGAVCTCCGGRWRGGGLREWTALRLGVVDGVGLRFR